MILVQLFTLAVTVAGLGAERYQAPGVAFRLTPDYGSVVSPCSINYGLQFDSVASIYLKNRTSVPIAQVYGSPEYRGFMRNVSIPAIKDKTALCRYIAPYLEYSNSLLGFTIGACRNADITSTLGVMHSLKTAVELYLGTNICYAALSLDAIEDHKKSAAEEALRAIGLRQVLPTSQVAKTIVAKHLPDYHEIVNGYVLDAPWVLEDPWTVIAIDHSSHWYNIGLFTVEEGISDPIDNFTKGPEIDAERQLEAMERTLSHIIANPPSGIQIPEHIHHIELYGDDANNASFHKLLANMLGAGLVRDAKFSNSIFDSTDFSARAVYENMDNPYFERSDPAAWGCKWRSKLYATPREDQQTG
ncbi:hypothetical protein NX059_009758 [Plenodomus lindquistii]|nr:hypothetical protein NX059_009758 [Plenodomus lindquistii]